MNEHIEVLDEANFKQIVSSITKDGWKLHRVRGSHHIFKHPESDKNVVVVNHGNKDLSPGLYKKIQRVSGMVKEDGEVGTTSSIPAVNTQSTGEAEIAAKPPVKKKKKLDLLTRSMQSPPKTLRSIIGHEMKNDRRADKR